VSVNLKKPKDASKVIIMKETSVCVAIFVFSNNIMAVQNIIIHLTFHVNESKLHSNHIHKYVGKKFGMKLLYVPVCVYV